MKQYLDLCAKIINDDNQRGDRTGTGTISRFGEKMVFDLREGFPLVTTKKSSIRDIARELIWFLNGETNTETLHPCKIWDEWALEDGETRAPYGWMWRYWPIKEKTDYVDQISYLIESIKSRPTSRRHLVSAWNVEYLPDETKSPHENVKDGKHSLPPCHLFFQCYVDGEHLDLQVYIRSNDMALGAPYNIASYSLLMHAIANEVGLTPRRLHYIMGDAHIYKNHIDGMIEQIKRHPYNLCRLKLKGGIDFKLDDIEIENYQHHEAIKYKISV